MRLARLPRRAVGPGLVVFRARDPWARTAGLAWMEPPPPGCALELPRCRSVHTAGMRFALDLVWLDRDGRPLRVDAGVAPWRLRGCRRARAVLECRAGEGARFAAALSRARTDGGARRRGRPARR